MADFHLSNHGNDGNDGSTSALAIKTIAKLNGIAADGSGLEPGDKVLFEKNSVFRESVYLPTQNDGAELDPIWIVNYGAGNKPVISGLRIFDTWALSDKGPNIYELYDANFPGDISGLIWAGVIRDRGRLPKTGVATYQTFTGNTSITSDEVIPDVDFSGGEVYAIIEKAQWVHDRVRVTGKSGNTITYTGGSSYSGGANKFFFIDNAIECLTAPGDWMFSPSEKKLYLFSTTNPNSLGIQFVSDQYNLHLDGAAFNRIDGLKLEGAWECALRSHVSGYATVLNSEFKNITGMGIKSLTAVSNHFEGNLFEDCLEGGISIANESLNTTVTKNVFKNIAMRLGYSGNGDGKGIGIYGISGNMTCSLNRLENIGYLGIRFYGSHTLVEKNYLDGFCLLKHDGGGIYCYGGTKDSRTFTNQTLRKNIIKNGGADPLSAAHGIYIDDNSEDIVIEDNLIMNVSRASYFNHNSHEITYRRNLMCGMGIGVQFAQNGDNELVRNNTVEHNIFVATSKNTTIYQLLSESDDLDLFADFNHNTFVLLVGGEFVVATRYKVGSKIVFNNYSWEQWQALGNDLDSRIIPLDVAEYNIVSEEENRFDFAGSNISSAFHQGGTAVVTKNPDGLPGTYKVEATVPSASTTRVEFGYPNLGPVDSSKKYLIRFKAMAPGGHQSLIIYARETQSPYRRLSRDIAGYATDQFRDYEFLLMDLMPSSQTSILIECQSNQGVLFVADFEFVEVEAEISDLEEALSILYNDTEDAVNHPLDGSWTDIDGVPLGASYPLASFESAVILKGEEVPEPENALPSIVITSPANLSANFEEPAIIPVRVSASDDVMVTKVEYFVNGLLVATVTDQPFAFDWEDVPAGSYTIIARANDAEGYTDSEAVSVTVFEPDLEPEPGPDPVDEPAGDIPGDVGLQIMVNGEFLELPDDFSVQFNRFNPVFQTEGFKQDDYTLPIPLPNSDHNARLLGNPAVVENESRFPPRMDAVIYYGGMPRVRGQLRIKSPVNSRVITVNFVSGVSEISPDIGKRKLREVMDEEIVINDHSYHRTVILKYRPEWSDAYEITINGTTYSEDSMAALVQAINDDPEGGGTATFLGDQIEIQSRSDNEFDEFWVDFEEGTVWNLGDSLLYWWIPYTGFYSLFARLQAKDKIRWPVNSNVNGVLNVTSRRPTAGAIVNHWRDQYNFSENRLTQIADHPRGQKRRSPYPRVTNTNSLAPYVLVSYVLDRIAQYYGISIQAPFLGGEDEAMIIDHPNTIDVPIRYIGGEEIVIFERSFNLSSLVPDMTVNEFLKALQGLGYALDYNSESRVLRYFKRDGILSDNMAIDLTGRHGDLLDFYNPPRQGLTLTHAIDNADMTELPADDEDNGKAPYIVGDGERILETGFSVPMVWDNSRTFVRNDNIDKVVATKDMVRDDNFKLRLAFSVKNENGIDSMQIRNSEMNLSWFGPDGLANQTWKYWKTLEAGKKEIAVKLYLTDTEVFDPPWTDKVLIDRNKYIISKMEFEITNNSDLIECDAVLVRADYSKWLG